MRLTADSVLVCYHDRMIGGRAPSAREVRSLTLTDLRGFRLANVADTVCAGAAIATVDEVFAVLKGNVGAYVDVKDATAESVVAAVRDHAMISSSVVYADTMMLRRMKLLAPALQTMPTLRAMRTPEEIAAIASNLHPFAINIGSCEASAEAVDAAHDLGALAFVDVMRMDTPEG
jgi:glycerophosphoryl diester phosphodiesterase